MLYCVHCGSKSEEGALYCSDCGHELYHGTVNDVGGRSSGRRVGLLVAGAVLVAAGVSAAVLYANEHPTHPRSPTGRAAANRVTTTTFDQGGPSVISPSIVGAYAGHTATVRMTVESVLDDSSSNGDQYLYPVVNPGKLPVLYYTGFDVVRFMDTLDAGAPSLDSYLGKTIDVTGEVTPNGSGGYEILVSPIGGSMVVVSG